MTSQLFLRQRYWVIFGYVGMIGLIISAVMLAPLVVLCAYPAERSLAWGFVLPGTVLLLLSSFLWRFSARQEKHPAFSTVLFSLTDTTVVVVLSWLLAITFGTVPFMVITHLSFTQAAFESTSGWTTTGLSVLSVERSPQIILFFRSLIQLCGGAGFAIIALSAISGPLATSLGAAEGRSEQLVPHIRRSAKRVLTLYSGYVILGVTALRAAGLDWFSAITHAFAALSTGGFSTQTDSIGHWQSLSIEAVTIVLMLLGSFNYLTGYLALTGRIRSVWRNSELRLQGWLTATAIVLLMGNLTMTVSGSARQTLSPLFVQAVRTAVFSAVTALSTTGFATVNYGDWHGLALLITIVLMMFGGQTGSTAGGLKLYRIYILFKAIEWKIKHYFLAEHAIDEVSLWQGERQQFLSEHQLLNIGLYVLMYFVVLLLGTGILAAHGYSLEASLFEYTSALSTVGLSVGITCANAPASVLWSEIIGMLLGRLEITTVLIGSIQIVKDLTVQYKEL